MQKLFVITRGDIPIGDQAVQAGHAVAEWCMSRVHPERGWNGTLVYVTLPNHTRLKMLQEKLQARRIDYIPFNEPDMNGELTSIACRGNDKLFAGMKLMGA